jgi:hypothetical protein
MDLEMQINAVRDRRLIVADQKAAIDARQAVFDKENELLLSCYQQEKVDLATDENKLRELTLAAYALTGNKKPAPGIGIRIMKELDYEEDQAIEWAVESGAGNCLKLDKKNFEKAAEALALDFVTINNVAQATIAKEL